MEDEKKMTEQQQQQQQLKHLEEEGEGSKGKKSNLPSKPLSISLSPVSPSTPSLSSSSSSNAYFKRRFDGKATTRREALDKHQQQFGKHSPRINHVDSDKIRDKGNDDGKVVNELLQSKKEKFLSPKNENQISSELSTLTDTTEDNKISTVPAANSLSPPPPLPSPSQQQQLLLGPPLPSDFSSKTDTGKQGHQSKEQQGSTIHDKNSKEFVSLLTPRRIHEKASTMPSPEIDFFLQEQVQVTKVKDESLSQPQTNVSKTRREESFSVQSSSQLSPTMQNSRDSIIQNSSSLTSYSYSFFQIRYRGIVSLLAQPYSDSPRSGAYVSYGEIILGSHVVQDDDVENEGDGGGDGNGDTDSNLTDTPCGCRQCKDVSSSQSSQPQSPPLSRQTNKRESREEELATHASQSTMIDIPCNRRTTRNRKVIRVHRVLTGGYTIDAASPPLKNISTTVAHDQTPKRGNHQSSDYPLSMITSSSGLPLMDNGHIDNIGDDDEVNEVASSLGYLVLDPNFGKGTPIISSLRECPKIESGSFQYKVVSSTPMEIYVGPSLDAPTTRGMLVPGTLHDISLRMTTSSDSITFLRLTRRQGWAVDRRHVQNSLGSRKTVILMRDAFPSKQSDIEGNNILEALPSKISTIITPVPDFRRRHKAPRKYRETKKDTIESSTFSRNMVGPTTHHRLLQSVTSSFDHDVSGHKAHDGGVMSPSSNISLLSDESSMDQSFGQRAATDITTPDRSIALSAATSALPTGEEAMKPSIFLMRVSAPRGLEILDAPHFQVNNLIHGSHPTGLATIRQSLSKDSIKSTNSAIGNNQSIFQTMSGGHHTTTMASRNGSPAIFDSNTKSRRIPRSSVFEASTRVEPSGAFSQGSGLIKLHDNSGWAIVPKREELDDQYRHVSGALAGIKEGEASFAVEEVGNAILHDDSAPVCIRIHNRTGLPVSLPVSSTPEDDATSPTSSAGGTSSMGSAANSSVIIRSQDSDVASSVGSSFLDAMFRTPKPKDHQKSLGHHSRYNHNIGSRQPASGSFSMSEKTGFSSILPCGSYVEVDRWSKTNSGKTEFARLRGGQGWIPRSLNGKAVTEIILTPETRLGSFWFQVRSKHGIKVRLGPSNKAPSIKSENGVYFRFECGEFLRASEVVTFFRQNAPVECFAKLYRNRHVRLYAGHGDIRPLSSLTIQAEWVQVFGRQQTFLEECSSDPKIERHQQGWRYNVVLNAQVFVYKGPSFHAEPTGVELLGGESILISERVTSANEVITWLRLKDGHGWVHNKDAEGEILMIPHSMSQRGPPDQPTKADRPPREDIAYNTIIARLFHNNDIHKEDSHSQASSSQKTTRTQRW